MFSWFNFLTYAVITAVTPGPNNIMSMTNASRFGFAKASPFNLGIWLGFSVVMLICTLLSSVFSTIVPAIQVPMKIIGAMYMLYLAYKTFKSSGEIKDNDAKNSFVAGALLQFINPKIYIYCIVSMQVYILPFFGEETMALVGFALLLAFIGFICSVLWSIFGSVFRLLFSKYAKVTNCIMSLLLVYCAISLFL